MAVRAAPRTPIITSGQEAIIIEYQTQADSGPAAGRPVDNRLATVEFRPPRATDGPAVSALIARCPPLDVNSAYCNLVQCAHFADTCVVAEAGGRIVGWLSGHRPPSAPEEVFAWQMAVDASMRGVGLGGLMIEALLARPAARDARVLTTTITLTNAASWAVFEGFARRRGLSLTKAPFFTREDHFAGAHDTEWLVRIALDPAGSTQSEKETT